MLNAIVKHEWRLLRADRTLHLLVALMIGVGLLAGYVGRASLQRQKATLAEARADEAARVQAVEQDLMHAQNGGRPAGSIAVPRLASVVSSRAGPNVALPPGPLAGLAVGQSDLYPQYFRVSHFTDARSFLANGELENPHNLLAGRFDLAFVIVYLLPLLILAVSYNLIAGEKEGGTLALALSQPVSLAQLLQGKLIVRGLLLVGLALLLTLLLALATGATLFSAQGLLRLGGVSLLIVLYSAFWFGLAVIINALARSSAFNATALSALWVAFVIVLPALGVFSAVALHPAPSRVELVGMAREASDEATRERSRLLSRYYEDHPEMLGSAAPDPANFAALGYVAQQEVNRRIQPVLDRFDERLAQQQALVRRYRFLSPAILANDALNDLAGTGEGRFAEFKTQAERFTETWKQFIVPRMLQADTMRPGVTAALPAFSFREERPGIVVARVAPALAGLALLAALASLAAVLTTRRFRMTA